MLIRLCAYCQVHSSPFDWQGETEVHSLPFTWQGETEDRRTKGWGPELGRAWNGPWWWRWSSCVSEKVRGNGDQCQDNTTYQLWNLAFKHDLELVEVSVTNKASMKLSINPAILPVFVDQCKALVHAFRARKTPTRSSPSQCTPRTYGRRGRAVSSSSTAPSVDTFNGGLPGTLGF